MNKRKICVITGTRAEYGLMYWLLKAIQEDEELELQLVVTGMHLSPEFGMTYQNIEEQGFRIDRKVEVLMSSDTSVGVSKSMGLTMISFSEVFEQLKPDICVVLGDRYEIFSAASAAMISRIPIAHLHGGETTEGAFDEALRHSITKMSHLHFVATKEYAKRVIQLGENPDNVFNLGSPGIDNIFNLDLLNKEDFEKSIDFKLGEKNFLITFHPVTLENNTSERQFQKLLDALSSFEDAKLIFTMPNSDTDGRIIIKMINDYVSKNKEKAVAFQSLGQLRYLSALQHIDAVIGNSSSGLAEAPSFKVATINIGDRQKGRLKANSVLDCLPEKKEIIDMINYSYSETFQNILKKVVNPYGEAGASEKIKDVLKKSNLENILLKHFYDL